MEEGYSNIVRQKGSWNGQKPCEPDPAADDRRAQVLQEEFLIRFINGQKRL